MCQTPNASHEFHPHSSHTRVRVAAEQSSRRVPTLFLLGLERLFLGSEWGSACSDEMSQKQRARKISIERQLLSMVSNISHTRPQILFCHLWFWAPNDDIHIRFLRGLSTDIHVGSVPHAFAFRERGQPRAFSFGAPLEALRFELVALACELEGVLTARA